MEDEDDIPGKVGDVIRIGLIASVDLAAGEAVVKCGDIETPPSPWTELAGNFRTWTPPSVSEQVIVLCPEGDIAGAVILRGVFSDKMPAKGHGEDHWLHGKDGLIIQLTPDGIRIEVPGDLEIKGNVTIDGDVDVTGTISADTDVLAAGISGRTHTHPGTGAPQ